MSTAAETIPFVCHYDQTTLLLAADKNALICPTCERRTSIRDGIPRFVDDQHLESFGHQWTRYEVMQPEEDRRTFEAKTGFRRVDLKGKRVLDAGCGGGRYTRLVAEAGAHVVAVDHTRAVEKAAQLCDGLSNIQFAQADLKALPLPHQSFDYVFSIGVMHHDADTRLLFNAVAELVKPGGQYAVWLYRRNQPWQERINTWLRNRTTQMSTARLEKWCRRGAWLGRVPLLNRTLNKVVNFSNHPVHENRLCDTYDWYAPKFQHHHTLAELLDWFEGAGFEELEILPPEKTGRIYRWAYEKDMIIGSGVNVHGRRKSG
ncbi:MAG: methyltransferase type 11 [Planctomyces sp.]|nr:methyltransferase type 11 [Planctomyces sp.]